MARSQTQTNLTLEPKLLELHSTLLPEWSCALEQDGWADWEDKAGVPLKEFYTPMLYISPQQYQEFMQIWLEKVLSALFSSGHKGFLTANRMESHKFPSQFW